MSGTKYEDAVAVIAALDRLAEDLTELIGDVRAVRIRLRGDLLLDRVDSGALAPTRRQLAWLAEDVARMEACLATEETRRATP